MRERTQKDAVIFAAKESGITNLAQVAGHRVAFGAANSTISFWAKVHLAQAGVHGTNLQSSSKYSGVTGTTLIVSNVTIEDYGEYTCAVTDLAGTISSANVLALLTHQCVPSACTNDIFTHDELDDA